MQSRTVLHAACNTAALALLAACSHAPAGTDAAKVDAEVKGAMASAIESFNSGDAARSTAIDAPDYVGMFHGAANVNGPAEDLKLTSAQVAAASGKLTVADQKVAVAAAGDMAVWTATYTYNSTDAKTKAPFTEHGNWVMVFRRQTDGTMKASLGVVSDTPAPTAAAPVT